MRYAIWNNKGGVGKSFLSFVLGAEIAYRDSSFHVILVDMCPQANLSEIVLGGNSKGVKKLNDLLAHGSRKTVGGYFDTRITSPHQLTADESSYVLSAHRYNASLPSNLHIIVGDPSLEIQAQVISQIGGQTLPQDSWKNVHNWLKDLVVACTKNLGIDKTTVLIDCNPSFSPYTELAMMAAERLIIPCSSDGSSARAIDNVASLLYGMGDNVYDDASFKAKVTQFQMTPPLVHSILFNRSTMYSKKASKAFQAMFDEIKKRVESIKKEDPSLFVGGNINFCDVPDTHSVAIVCSHSGLPLTKFLLGNIQSIIQILASTQTLSNATKNLLTKFCAV